MSGHRKALASTLAVAWLLTACGGGNQQAATPTPAPTPKPKQVVIIKEVGTQGKILVAASNEMTVYTFTRDTANSGKSACGVTGGCLDRWPPLTVQAGEKPTGGPGVVGFLNTITRDDNQALQVTYNGLPLYFFINDKAVGDTKGIYPNWLVVKP